MGYLPTGRDAFFVPSRIWIAFSLGRYRLSLCDSVQWRRRMRLLKFNLILIPFILLAFGAIAYVTRKTLFEAARQQVIQNARIIMETMLSSRTYTTKQVAPLLEQKNFKLQTAISEFRKTITEIPKTPDPTAAKDIKGSAKKSFLLGQQQALDAQQQFLASMKDKPEELLDNEFHP